MEINLNRNKFCRNKGKISKIWKNILTWEIKFRIFVNQT
jgi:hypothetical protein